VISTGRIAGAESAKNAAEQQAPTGPGRRRRTSPGSARLIIAPRITLTVMTSPLPAPGMAQMLLVPIWHKRPSRPATSWATSPMASGEVLVCGVVCGVATGVADNHVKKQ